MKEYAYIFRLPSTDQGTEGHLITADFACRTLELPWRNNMPNRSCIPPGIYEAVIRSSSRFGRTYWILEVEGRSWILIHSLNLAGDVEKGWKTHSEGCIGLGKYMGWLHKQRAVLLSRVTVRKFINHMKNKPFTLEIIQF
jgi:hypothetical protein